jgi:hypothetical protein
MTRHVGGIAEDHQRLVNGHGFRGGRENEGKGSELGFGTHDFEGTAVSAFCSKPSIPKSTD